MSNKIVSTPEWDALHAFDHENNVEPFRVIAQRIAIKYGYDEMHYIVDDISSAIEDAYNLGERRGPLATAALSRT